MNYLQKMSHYLVQQVGHQVLVDREQVPYRPVQAVDITAVLYTLSGLQWNMKYYSLPISANNASTNLTIRKDGDGDSVLPALLHRL